MQCAHPGPVVGPPPQFDALMVATNLRVSREHMGNAGRRYPDRYPEKMANVCETVLNRCDAHLGGKCSTYNRLRRCAELVRTRKNG